MGMLSYGFAHQLLPHALLSHPRPFTMLAGPVGTEYVRQMWELAAERIAPGTPIPEELRALPPRVGGPFVCAVIVMPPPQEMTEAHMVALVGRLSDPALASLDDVRSRAYYTLEAGSGGTTVLGQWTADGSHLNLGSGPEPTADAFVLAIGEHLSRGG